MTPATAEVEHPIKLPKFTLISGGVGAASLAKALAAPLPNTCIVELHDLGYWLAARHLATDGKPDPKVTIGPRTVENFAFGIDVEMERLIGEEYAAEAFINQYDNEDTNLVEDDYIFVDATIADILAFRDRFGDDNLLVLETGPMRGKALSKNTVWLPSPDLMERIKLLKRELGVL